MSRQYFAECECTLTTCMSGSRARKRCSNSQGKQLARERRKASKKKKKKSQEHKEERRRPPNQKAKGQKKKKTVKRERKMFPWPFMPGLESGRSRRRRESSSDSRRKRRNRRRRDSTRSRDRSRGRSPRSHRSEASSSLPTAAPGYRWCQIPETVLHGGTGPAVTQAPLPPPAMPPADHWPQQRGGVQVEPSSSWREKPWQPPQKTWGQQNWSQRGSGSSSKWSQGWGQQRDKGWNKWPKKDESRAWAKQDPKDKPPEASGVFGAVPEAPEDDTHRVAEATNEEIEAAAARQVEREEQGFHDQLWQEATQKALVDPERPLCVRELVKEDRLTAWWSLPWKDARTQIDGTLVDEYRGLLRSYFVEPDEGPGTLPEVILERCACIFAYFKQNGRPVFESEGRAIEASIFKVPGQKVVSFPTAIHGPSYKEPKNHRYSMTISHGLPWTSVLGVGQLGELAPGDFTEGDFPTYGFSGRGSCDEFTQGSIRASITKVAARAKGKDVILTMEGQLEVKTPHVEGGMYHLNAACRDAGSARSGDHLLLHPRNAVLKAFSVPWPA